MQNDHSPSVAMKLHYDPCPQLLLTMMRLIPVQCKSKESDSFHEVDPVESGICQIGMSIKAHNPHRQKEQNHKDSCQQYRLLIAH
jgi:hypothetical protein